MADESGIREDKSDAKPDIAVVVVNHRRLFFSCFNAQRSRSDIERNVTFSTLVLL